MRLLIIVVLTALILCSVGALAHEPVCTISIDRVNKGTFVCEENVIRIRASDIFLQSIKPITNAPITGITNSTAKDPFGEGVMASLQKRMREDMERTMLEDILRDLSWKEYEKHDRPTFVRGSSGWGIEINWGN